MKSFARPGGNATGATNRAAELHTKRIELALELVPGAKRIALYGGWAGPLWDALLADARKAALGRGVELVRATASGSMESALATAVAEGAQAVVFVLPSTSAPVGLELGIRVLRERRVPSIFMDAARLWFADRISDEEVIARVGGNYARLAAAWRKAREACKESVS